jgi:hypothetical protein
MLLMQPRRIIRSLALSIGLALCSSSIDALDLSSYVGYTIVAAKTVTGYRDKNGKHSHEFEGCDFDRVIVFDDGTKLTCSSYSYSYSYRPEAVILMKNSEYQGRTFALVVMIVDDEEYEMSPVIPH